MTKRKTIARYHSYDRRGKSMGFKDVEKELLKGEGLDIKFIDYKDTTAWQHFADVEFYDKAGKWTINLSNVKKIEDKILKNRKRK